MAVDIDDSKDPVHLQQQKLFARDAIADLET